MVHALVRRPRRYIVLQRLDEYVLLTLGGVFVEVLDSGRWIFFVNIPLALFAGWTLIRRFHEDVERVRPTGSTSPARCC